MKITAILLLACFLSVSAGTYAQKITLSEKRASLDKILTKIRIQSGYDFVYNSKLIKDTKPVTVTLNNSTLEDALKACLNDQGLTYSVEERTVLIAKKVPSFLDKVVDAFTPPISVYGIVLNEKGLPLVGATVKVKGFQQATTTDAQGRFTLNGVDDKAVLVISYVGYAPKEVSAKSSISVSLEIQSAELQEVNVAYGKITRQANVGAVSVVEGKRIENTSNSSFDRSLQGLVPGLQVNNGGGQPGGSVTNFIIRGIGTGIDPGFGSTVRNPLIVIDGVPVLQDVTQYTADRYTSPPMNPLAQLNPNDIAEVTVLKDASAIALYGTKASNGVILVTTKKGHEGRTEVSVRSQFDMALNIKSKTNVLNKDQYLMLLNDAYINSDPTTWNSATILADLQSKFPYYLDQNNNPAFYQSPSWNSELYDRAISNSTDLSIQGGSEKSAHYLNLNHALQDGTLKNTSFERTALRANLNNALKDWLTTSLNSTFSYSKQKQSDQYGTAENANGFGLTSAPLLPNRLNSGEYQYLYPYGTVNTADAPGSNPLASKELNYANNSSYRALADFFAEVSFLKKFKFKSSWGTDVTISNEKLKVDPRLTRVDLGVYTAGTGFVSDNAYIRYNIIGNNTLRYNEQIAKHGFEVLLGQESQLFKRKTIPGNATNFTSPFFDQLSNGSSTYAFGDEYKETLTSFFAQANYNYDGKYYFSASGRRDGSSKFGERERFGNFGSIGAGWILSEEGFVNAAEFINYLKVRGSYGSSGNSNAIDARTRFDLLTFRKYNSAVAVQQSTSPGNSDIKWENTVNSDLGLEAKLFNSRVSFTVDIYKRKINDMIYAVNLPATTGYVQVLDNFGEMENSGLEVSMSVNALRKKDINWLISGNWSKNRNKLTKAYFPEVASTYTINKVGENFDSYYMPVWAGVNLTTGLPQWLDAQNNPTSNYSSAQKRIVGKPQPDGYGTLTNTLNYKQFELGVSLYYQYGSKVYDDRLSTLLNDGASPYVNQAVQALDYWKNPGDIASNPRRVLDNADGGNLASTRYLLNGDFLRLQNVHFSYTLTPNLAQTLHLNSARVFFQGSNLATWTRDAVADPDNAGTSGVTYFAYPQQRVFSFGINLTL